MTCYRNIFSRVSRLLLLVLLVTPFAAHAQGTPPLPETAGRYGTSGLYLHARFAGHGMAFDGPGDAEGGGFGLRAGYGFSDRFTVYLGVEGAGLTGGRGFEGLGDDEEYGVAYVELGSRLHFRPGQRLMPYADVALTVVGLGYDGSGTYAGDDVTYGGAGVSMGGGLLYFFAPRFALDGGIAFTPGSLMQMDVDGRTEDADIKLAGARIHVGVSFYPFR